MFIGYLYVYNHLNLAWNWLLKIRFCHPSVDFSTSKQADTDPAARLLDGWQEGVVPLVLQKALWSEAETEREPSVQRKQSRPKLDRDRLTHGNPLPSAKNRLSLYILRLLTLFKCHFKISLHFDGIPTWLPQHKAPPPAPTFGLFL